MTYQYCVASTNVVFFCFILLFSPSGRKFVRSNTLAVIDVEKELLAKSAQVVCRGRESLINQKNSMWLWAPRGREEVLQCQAGTDSLVETLCCYCFQIFILLLSGIICGASSAVVKEKK